MPNEVSFSLNSISLFFLSKFSFVILISSDSFVSSLLGLVINILLFMLVNSLAKSAFSSLDASILSGESRFLCSSDKSAKSISAFLISLISISMNSLFILLIFLPA